MMGKKEAINFEDLISLFQYQGVVTLKQACELLKGPTNKEVAENTVRDTLKRYCEENVKFGNAIFWKGSAPRRSWIKTNKKNVGAPETMYALYPEGADLLYQYTGIEKKSPNDKTDKNILHALALVDIAIKCVAKELSCKINRQVNYTPEKTKEGKEEQRYIRPDIQFIAPASQKTAFIEYEQSRPKIDLFHMVINRMARWEELFCTSEAESFSRDIIILFNLDDDDKFTIETWMRALSEFEKSVNHPAHFRLYYRNFQDFYEIPSFDVNSKRYKKIEASEEPKQTLYVMENRARTLQYAEEILTNLDGPASTEAIQDYVKDNWQLFEVLQNASNRQVFFLNQVQNLYTLSHRIERTGYAEASKPWAGILIIQKWLEQVQLSRLRSALTESITTIYALSKKNQQSAAMAYEQMVWDVLFKYFNFASGGPLHFRITTSNDSEDRVYDLVPDTHISTPWVGVFEDRVEADKSEAAINWFVTMIVRYQEEIGLTRSRHPYRK
jgi:hypothetical protein